MAMLLLIRHAMTDMVNKRLSGWTPGVSLNEEGRRQAEALAERLAEVPLTAIYSSPLDRAVETAQAVAGRHGLEVQIRKGLGESDYGEWTGQELKELAKTEIWKQIQANPVGVRVPGGETIDEVQARVVAALDEIIRSHDSKAIIAAVSHADVLKAAISHYLGLDLNRFQRLVISPASVSALLVGEQGALLVRMNDSGPFRIERKPEPAEPEPQPPGRE